ncbi:unnamed protein product [Spirodela intermedia]|uniref:BHLH domain-containing protein n=1 Tax=Spirodela intermedia TaxID=51605 RepID=A0A7I8JG89_SPIIN|nr:unnamed protein product [Spirodela intermedia]CAA6669167.1 unnamed protein product [Spirodela intermedia]
MPGERQPHHFGLCGSLETPASSPLPSHRRWWRWAKRRKLRAGRRRERIKLHLDRLRSILSCDAKVEKASLLAKAVEHVKDLKQRAAEVGEMDDRLPTESDEVSVHAADLPAAAGGGVRRPILKASLCCEDRSGLLPELAETLKSLSLRILRAEISTVGGRVRNVLVVAAEDDGAPAAFLADALKALAGGAGGMDHSKRRRRLLGRSATTG